MATKYSDPNLSTIGSQGTVPFKLSDILNIGDWFGNASEGKGAKRTSATEAAINGAGEAAMEYAMADKTGNTKLQRKGKIADSAFDAAAQAVQFIPGVGTALSYAMQGFQLGMKHLAPDLKNIQLNKTLASSSAYSGLSTEVGNKAADVNAFNSAGVGRFFMGKKSIKNDIDTLNSQQQKGVGVIRDNQKLMAAAGANTSYQNNLNNLKFNGFGTTTVPVGKLGLNTAFLEEFRQLRKSEKLVEIRQLQKGGPINVIVSGKLHKELNHMKDLVDIDITRKGVPVVALEEKGGPIEQTAELERDEIILHLQLTKKLEELAKENTDESMIEAGKLLTKEILRNTKDSKSKLLKTVE